MALEQNGVNRAPFAGAFVEYIDHVQRKQLVRHSKVQAYVMHGLRAGNGFGELPRSYFGGGVAPVQAERGDAGVLHGGRGGVVNGKSVHGTQACAGGNGLGVVGHGRNVTGHCAGVESRVT